MQYKEYGKQNRDVIILLHGGGLSWWNYREVSERLQNDFRIIIPILDGHAGSDENFTTIEDNAAEIFVGYKIVCEAFDKAENKAMLVNSILSECGDTKIVSGSGMAGFGSSNTIVTRKINDRFYLCGDAESDMNDGLALAAPRVAICAAHEANMILRLLIGEKEV